MLETRQIPDGKVVAYLAESLKLPANKITLLAAPAASIAGTFQVVARSLETTLHKLHELKFDLGQVVSGFGTAPLPPVAVNDLLAIGRTNDAILYGGRVVLWVRADDAVIDQIGPKVPSSGSKDHGAPFAEIFARYNQDFYKIDPMLFSPGRGGLPQSENGQEPCLRPSGAGGAAAIVLRMRRWYNGMIPPWSPENRPMSTAETKTLYTPEDLLTMPDGVPL